MIINQKYTLSFILESFQGYIKSFLKMDECIKSNSIGSHAVFNFCLSNNIKLVYSALLQVLEIKEKIKLYPHMLLQKPKI